MAMPAAAGRTSLHKISKGITYYHREPDKDWTSPLSTARPLLLLFPWLGARPQALSKYFQAYSGTCCDVLMVETDISKFLWPRWGLDYGAEILEVLQSDRFASRTLLVHSFSIGAFTFTQLLVHVSRDPQRYHGLIGRVKGHVYDSLVIGSVENMAAGVGKNTFPKCEGLVRWTALLYFRVCRKYTLDNFNVARDIFWNSPVKAPALFFFCENDIMCDPKEQEKLIEYWRKRGVAVQSRKWAESTHAGHLRDHGKEYLSSLNTFLLSLSPLKAKM